MTLNGEFRGVLIFMSDLSRERSVCGEHLPKFEFSEGRTFSPLPLLCSKNLKKIPGIEQVITVIIQ